MANEANAAAKSTSSSVMMLSMGTVGFFAGLLIVFSVRLTAERIRIQEDDYKKSSVRDVLPGTREVEIYEVRGLELVKFDPKRVEKGKENEKKVFVYAGYGEGRELVGVAVEAQGNGFQDTIFMIYGYSPEKDSIVGMKVLGSKETPGLGDRIEKDMHFLENFHALDVALSPGGEELMHPLAVVKRGEKANPWEIDAITGATISSKAIGRILRENTARMVPVIRREENLRRLKERP